MKQNTCKSLPFCMALFCFLLFLFSLGAHTTYSPFENFPPHTPDYQLCQRIYIFIFLMMMIIHAVIESMLQRWTSYELEYVIVCLRYVLVDGWVCTCNCLCSVRGLTTGRYRLQQSKGKTQRNAFRIYILIFWHLLILQRIARHIIWFWHAEWIGIYMNRRLNAFLAWHALQKCMRNVLIIPSFSASLSEVKKKFKFINPLDWNRRHHSNNVNDKLRQALSPSVTWIEFKFLNYVFSSFGRCLHSIEQTS